MGEVGLRQIRDGARVLRFQAAVLGAATSQRGSVPRWSELVVYKMADDSYMISKVGRSTVAHRQSCLRVNHRMVFWSQAALIGEDRVERVPCGDCHPDLHPPLDPWLRLEVTRYRAIWARDAENAVSAMGDPLADPTFPLPRLVREVLAQCAQVDDCFARYAEADRDPNPLEKTTRTG
jgi:hypothetical protein